MKKIILSALTIIALIPSLAHADKKEFNGLYVGVGLGAVEESFKITDNLNSSIIAASLNVSVAKSISATTRSALANINVGYSKLIRPSNFIALEAHMNFQSLKDSVALNTSAVVSGTPTTAFQETISLKQLSPSFGIAIRPGVLLSPKTALYGIAGAELSRFKVSSTASYSQNLGAPVNATAIASSSTSSTKVGALFGAGIESYINDKFKLGLEYNYVNFGKIKAPYLSGNFTGPSTGTLITNDKVTTQSSAIIFKLTYHFVV